ncbi:MAG TPA: hypothetical protein VFF65_07925, partial [Phycisphaerales bacterium]|nr:hypothetical protein [Phycisphaerales bacterium]
GATLTLAGCNLFAGAYLIAHGPEKVKAVFTLPKERTAVIALDDRGSVIPQRNLRDVIGKTAEEELLTRQLVKEMVASRLASAVMARERSGVPMGIAELGQAVKADVVIYVVMDQFTLSEDGTTLSPLATGRVKVVDSATGKRLGPPEDGANDYYQLVVRLPAQAGTASSTSAQLQQLQDLARLTGLGLSRLFYDAEVLSAPTKLQEPKR